LATLALPPVLEIIDDKSSILENSGGELRMAMLRGAHQPCALKE
jgi:hypothetical protein